MNDGAVHLELKQVLTALLFGANNPMQVPDLKQVLRQAGGGADSGRANPFRQIKDSDIKEALDELKSELAERKLGIQLVDVAGGYRFQTDPACGLWLRELLKLNKPQRLSHPALETLAIIAYRQPISRSEIEAVRGVNVDHIVRHLLEIQLIRIVGRSNLPGRPILYGTTQLFLEHFGLKSAKDLPGRDQLCKREDERAQQYKQPAEPSRIALGADGNDVEKKAQPENPEGAPAEAQKPENPEGAPDEAQKPEKPEGASDEAQKPENPEGAPAEAQKPENQEGASDQEPNTPSVPAEGSGG